MTKAERKEGKSMATEERTLERLQYLEALYRQGYRSEVVDRSLEKLVALEKAAARRELTELEERIRVFETRYQMLSETFYQRFRTGELGDAADMVEWSVFYEMWQSVRERLAGLEAESS
jgi:hypothetical protein